jgi:hypothetical protein
MVFAREDRQAQEKNMNAWQRKLLAFVAVDEGLTDESLIKKGAATAILFPSFRLIEWLLVAATATIFSLFKYYGLTEISIWLILWALNLILSGSVILFNDYIKVDITLMQTARKFINALIERKKMAGYFLELAVVLRLLLWDGPDQLFIFFRQRLRSKVIQAFFFITSSGVQMFVWAKIYSYGYDGISDLVKTWMTRST